MSLVSVKHSLAAFGLIKKQIKRILKTINIIVQIVFFLFYGFMIYTHRDSIPMMIAYGAMLLVSIFVFIAGLALETKDEDEKAVKKLKKRTRKKIKRICKVIKYICNIFAIGFTIATMFLLNSWDILTIASTIASSIFLAIQIIFNVIGILFDKYIEMLRLGIKLDVDDSGIMKVVDPLGEQNKKAQKEVDAMEGRNEYNDYEQKIVDDLRMTAHDHEVKKKETLKEKLKENLQKIKDAKKEKKKR